jgi:hypothetical protein
MRPAGIQKTGDEISKKALSHNKAKKQARSDCYEKKRLNLDKSSAFIRYPFL